MKNKLTLVWLAGFLALSLACTGWLFARIGYYTGPAGLFSDAYSLTAAFSDATGLVPNDEVRLAGVDIGRVTGVKVERGKAVVSMTIDERYPVPEGSRFELRWKNLLGQRFLEVLPPSGASADGPRLADGAAVPAQRTGEAADLTLLLNNSQPIFSRLDTASLNRVLATFAAALNGREQVVSRAIDDSQQVVASLAGRADAIGSSIESFATLLEGIAAHDAEVRALLDSLASTSEVLGAQADDLGVAAGKAGEFTTSLTRVLAASEPHIDTVFDQTRQVLDMVVRNKDVLDKSLRTLPWTTAAILRMTSHGDWIQSYTRGVGIIDAHASEPRIGPDYNDTGPDDPNAPDPLLGQPRVPVPPIPSTDAGVIAVNPAPGAPKKDNRASLQSLLAPLTGAER